ncbi:MAG: hypothetical protein U1E05_06745, partial [Patescibacteria group bacterium]|nr:hypothetical protein [Patescibacteria group bacterium]
MTDRTKGDHWGHLASELGAEIREDAAPVQSEPTGPGIAPGENQAAACASPAKRAEVETPRRPRPAANWNAIASSLGLETPPEVLPAAQAIVKPAECPAEVHKPSAEVGPELGDLDEPAAQPRVSTAQLAETVASLPESVKAAPAGIGHEPTMLIGHEAPAAGAGFGMGILEEKPASDDGGEPARGKSRRRRRRKPRSGERQPASGDSGQVSGSDVDSEIESCDEPCGQSELESVVEGESLGSESASESDSEEKRRS